MSLLKTCRWALRIFCPTPGEHYANQGVYEFEAVSITIANCISFLLHATMANTTYGPNGKDGLQRPDFEIVGQTSFTQLAELRHRGAFSTVSQTFATCCLRCSKSDDPSIQDLPRRWYQASVAAVRLFSELIETRRQNRLFLSLLPSSHGAQLACRH